MGANIRRAFTGGAFQYNSVSRCTRLAGATLIQADLEDTFFERSSYDVLKDNTGCP